MFILASDSLIDQSFTIERGRKNELGIRETWNKERNRKTMKKRLKLRETLCGVIVSK